MFVVIIWNYPPQLTFELSLGFASDHCGLVRNALSPRAAWGEAFGPRCRRFTGSLACNTRRDRALMVYRDVIKSDCSRSHERRTVMATDVTAIGSAGHRYPMIAAHADAARWIRSCAMLGLAGNTIAAYSRAMEIFLGFCQSRSVEARCATRELIAQYVHYLRTRPRQGRGNCEPGRVRDEVISCGSILRRLSRTPRCSNT
jgi:hypothetical protein